ncbi:PaaI family thioesterase [Subtercola endophyticus]|uniref:PaaI family thioesterase n=1 Tax=Subtercola endophyticus TaxID=2895559 RepID=UPI001E5BEAF4|nr:PaaI family thioesterase [Subtercola endophyticus]UFS58162.1 PaaI family thioesterase [Subtercola endophyticus]
MAEDPPENVSSSPSSAFEQNRASLAALGSALREVGAALAATDVDSGQLDRAAALAREITAIVGAKRRSIWEVPSVDDMARGIRYFNPVTGLGSPASPPIVFEHTSSGVVARAILDRRFEGPPAHLHGGVSALILDSVLAQAATQADRWGMTAYLNVTYLSALPLEVELVFRSHIVSTSGRKTVVKGTIVVASAPEVVCVEAEALFIEPSAEKKGVYFSKLTDAHGAAQGPGFGSRSAP